MNETYSGRNEDDANGERAEVAGPAAREASAHAHATAILARLLPGWDAELLHRALMDEAAGAAPGTAVTVHREVDLSPPIRELRRLRLLLQLGDAARTLQHSLNNPLTALLAEAQLLELEALPDEHRQAVVRIIELARRVASVARRLEVDIPRIG
jgi:signal transduction histidine kinase